MTRIRTLLRLLVFSLLPFSGITQSGRVTTDLSGLNWKLWLDTAATWQNDTLFAPPVQVSSLPVHEPTGGWEALYAAKGKAVTLPATTEQFFWGQNGNSFGVAGNYLGVSWFTTSFMVPASERGKRVALRFESVRFRAEIFINRRLAGYDLVNGTPFEIDISSFVKFGAVNEIAVRITDPNGNFDWRDSQNFMWGKYRTNPTHGFGGITGKLSLVTMHPVHVADIFVKNRPNPHEADAEITLSNEAGREAKGVLQVDVLEAKPNGRTVYSKNITVASLNKGETTFEQKLYLPDAKLWSVDSPNLYSLKVTWKGADNRLDTETRRFGFRWFEVRYVAGDRQFYLNGRRMVLITSISWGFWPGNGIAPTNEMARKQVQQAKILGLNMLNFHRTIGQTNVLDAADELGLLYFEEPGGNQYPADRFNSKDPLGKMQAEFYLATRNEKFFRMIRRDRSHPSLVIYNMHNERGAEPLQEDSAQMLAGQRLDETRIITYNSSNGSIKMGPDPRFKLHLMPYDTVFRSYGWFDQHHAGGPGVYHDNLYKGPDNYAKYFDHKDEIIYYGEEGAIGAPPRLELIRKEISKAGDGMGWESRDYIEWYEAYQRFLQSDKGFLKVFPSVDSLTKAMGNTAYYYQGRVIENVHISNLTDGYAINGWESMKLENHSGIVDNYRNFKGNPDLIARYNRPLYLAVKLNRKVMGAGDTTVADFYVVNRKELKGDLELRITVKNALNQPVFQKREPVKVSGGVVYGELLLAGIPVRATSKGYGTVEAELVQSGKVVATGSDDFFTVG